jgi:hypothetical protein
MKGLAYSGVDLIDLDSDDVPEHDWFVEFATVLIAQQQPGGWWVYDMWANENFSTVWALLTLEKIAPPPPFTIVKDFRYTSVDFTPYHWEDPDGIPDNGDEFWMQDPAILGDLLPMDADGNYLVDVVVHEKTGKVKSTNPGQLYGVISITGAIHKVSIEDNFDKEFDINPAKYGGGIEVLIVDPMGYATVITHYPGLWGSVWNDIFDDALIYIDLDTAIGGPLPPDHTLMIYVKFQTAMKHQVFPDPTVPYDYEFWNRPNIWINEDDWTTDPPTTTIEAIIELSTK